LKPLHAGANLQKASEGFRRASKNVQFPSKGFKIFHHEQDIYQILTLDLAVACFNSFVKPAQPIRAPIINISAPSLVVAMLKP
jgi:hypothetical protein